MKSVRSHNPGRYAAIDIGTVTARLLVADVDERGVLSEVAKDMDICNLGVGVDKTRRLAPDAIERVGVVVGRFKRSIDDLQPASGGPIVVTANATSASRDAENSADFVDVLAELGIELSVIPGEKEAALSFAGASSAFPGEEVVVLDVGGGSSEVIAGEAGGTPRHAKSFNIGCRRVTERYFEDDPPTRAQIDAAGSWIADSMRPYFDELLADGFGGKRVVAVAGTATSMVSMHERMEEYDSSRVHRAVVSRADVDRLLAELSSQTLVEREHVVGLDPRRAPVIVAGVLIIQQIMELLGAESITVSECDILHGIILDTSL